ncbi:hypothetical protein CHS0354_036699 [Potamilus streckersoni]|uniref:Uncharacterized protein n=1 Tax=Potamilus streckersoni TaxID=2493646 RepID=A0AAE0VSE8_9BIVA|nr:hypothetical protein CHS0354_036699 [Potamilus streckersoni]
MVQSKSGSIRHMRKGCCLTDRPVMLSMLVLLMAIQVIFACHCDQIDWEKLMCHGVNKTVIMASVKSGHGAATSGISSAMQRIFKLDLENSMQHGPNNLSIQVGETIIMITPQNCSASLKNDTMYIMYGDTDVGGIFHSTNCSIEVFDDGFFNKTGRENLTAIIWGNMKPSC